VTIGLAWLNAAEIRGRLGIRAAAEERADAAADLFTTSLAELRAVQRHALRTGFVGLEPCALAYQVVPLIHLGRLDEAVAVGEQAILRAGALELDDSAAQALRYAGQARLARGDLAEAAAHLDRALALYDQWELTHETGLVLELLVETRERLGDLATAFELHKRLLVAMLRLRDGLAERTDQVAAARYEAEREQRADEWDRRQLAQLARANRRLADERRAMERLAHTDALTGLANRRHFDAQLGRLLVHTALTGEELSLVLIDIDHFKRVNDRHSHLVGDAVLRALATEITRHCRVSDLAARIGGEEFVVLLPNTGRIEALAVAERLRASVEKLPLDQLAEGLRITVSAGVAGTATGIGADALLAEADAALYQAKRGGRNRVRGSA
jgi:diguanylate cyclase (GGDEF)-like protein